MYIDGVMVNDRMNFIFMRLGRLGVGATYRVFIHNNALYGGRVAVQFNKVAAKYAEKYEAFNGTAEEFLELDRKNFIIYSHNIREILFTLTRSRKTGALPNNGTIELIMQNGKKERFVLYLVNVPALIAGLKKEVGDQIYIITGKRGREAVNAEEIVPGMCCCTRCGTDVDSEQSVYLPPEGKKNLHTLVCRQCYRQIEEEYQLETEEANIHRALLVGFLAAVFSAFLWYGVVVLTGYQLGIIAVAVGWVLANAVIRGAGNKRGPVVQKISVCVTVLAMVLSEYLIIRYYIVLELTADGIIGIPLILPIEAIIELIGIGIQSNPMTLLFWGIAVFEAYKIPARRSVPFTGSMSSDIV